VRKLLAPVITGCWLDGWLPGTLRGGLATAPVRIGGGPPWITWCAFGGCTRGSGGLPLAAAPAPEPTSSACALGLAGMCWPGNTLTADASACSRRTLAGWGSATPNGVLGAFVEAWFTAWRMWALGGRGVDTLLMPHSGGAPTLAMACCCGV